MPKIIIDIALEDTFVDGRRKKDHLSIKPRIEGHNSDTPSSADHIAAIIHNMLPTVIEAAGKYYVQGLNSDGTTKSTAQAHHHSHKQVSH
jgi:hypothetical protein